MEQSDDGALELGTTASIVGRGREGLPNNRFADVSRDEKRDTRAKTVTLLEQLVEQDNDQACSDKLNYEEDADAGAEVRRGTVKAGKNENGGLTKGDYDGEQLLCGLVELTVGLQVEIDVNEMGASKQLYRLNMRLCGIPRLRRTWKTMPEEIIGVIPSSISVPRLLANIIRSQ